MELTWRMDIWVVKEDTDRWYYSYFFFFLDSSLCIWIILHISTAWLGFFSTLQWHKSATHAGELYILEYSIVHYTSNFKFSMRLCCEMGQKQWAAASRQLCDHSVICIVLEYRCLIFYMLHLKLRCSWGDWRGGSSRGQIHDLVLAGRCLQHWTKSLGPFNTSLRDKLYVIWFCPTMYKQKCLESV